MARQSQIKSNLKNRSILAASLIATAASMFVVSSAEATRRYDPMSLKPGSESIAASGGTVNIANIYSEVILPGNPLPGTGPIIDIDGLEFGAFSGDNTLDFSASETDPAGSIGISFSVSEASNGTPGGAVATEKALITSGHASDVFDTRLSGNIYSALGGTPATGSAPIKFLDESAYNFLPGDDNDGFERSQFKASAIVRVLPIYFAKEGSGQTGNQILLTPVGVVTPGLFANGTALGLAATDIIDGLSVWDLGTPGTLDVNTDLVVFSLRIGSPSLPSATTGGANLYVSDFDGTFLLWASAANIGLLATDEIDALDVFAIPEPTALALIAFAAIPMLRRRRA